MAKKRSLADQEIEAEFKKEERDTRAALAKAAMIRKRAVVSSRWLVEDQATGPIECEVLEISPSKDYLKTKILGWQSIEEFAAIVIEELDRKF